MKRVDWDPNGERNTENRGRANSLESPGNEAYIIANEIERIQTIWPPDYAQVTDTGNATINIRTATACLDKIGFTRW
jgi:hypothetical protein